ncbi:irregular chiasm C-roughest protein-like isoform X2 [Toxorhynchites rutilus septentrionalis]|uniref:irregular chiasm C-roughest protein-like isoform X2 n=1 Tax=Toxorhynchites rutilus septentrionalis TaxID=329112 RepID=UPI00247AC1AD|nr:irregular chiasm C-roughest protein-like isoform X2 [Toxorhynchites rutilus septentrionalis]
MSQTKKLNAISSKNRSEEKSCRSQKWSKRRRRKWMPPSSSNAIPFRYFYLFLLLRIAVEAAKSSSAGGGEKSHVQQRFALEPQDQTAVVGSRVTLPCRVVNKSGQLQWTKDDFGLGTHRDLSGFERYSMVGSDEEGDFSLGIFPVMLDDDAKYQCQVGPGKRGTAGIRSRFATLTVLVPPEPPQIVQGDFMVTTEGREIELECVSVGGRPAAEITWIDGLGNVLTDGIEYMKEALPNQRRFTAKSILKLTPKKEHHNTTFSCQAQNTADRTYRSVRLKLEVKFAPKVEVELMNGDDAGRIPQGGEVRLHCHADANPPDVTYKWYIGNELIVGNSSVDLVIANTSKKFHGVIVDCEVRNAVGKGEAGKTLDIRYGPVFRSLPTSVEADSNTGVTLICDVDGNPPPDIVWIHDESGRVLSTSANLTLTVTPINAGRYFCKASVHGFAEIAAEAFIYLKGPPNISSPRQQFGTVTDTGMLECEAFSVPRAKHIIWAHNGREINTSAENEYTVVESHQPEGVKSTLIIHNSQRQHFGGYNCTVINDYGIDFVEIDFVSKENILLPVIIFGSLGGLTLLIIIIVTTMCFRGRKGRKKLPPADVIPKHISEKDCKELERRTSNAGDLKLDCDNEFIETCLGPDGMTTQVNVVLGSSATIANHNRSGPSDGAASVGSSVKTSSDYRFSGDFTESLCQPANKSGGSNSNNGHVPYVDYSHDYSPPAAHLIQFRTSTSSSNINSSISNQNQTCVNSSGHMTLGRPRLSELRQDKALPSIQGNLCSLSNGIIKQPALRTNVPFDSSYSSPYMRSNSTSFTSIPPATANLAITPAPPPYNVATRSSHGFNGGGAATISLGYSPGAAGTDSTSPISPQSGSLSLSQTSHPGGEQTGGAATTCSNSSHHPGSPSAGQFILPSSGTVKQHQHQATHV